MLTSLLGGRGTQRAVDLGLILIGLRANQRRRTSSRPQARAYAC